MTEATPVIDAPSVLQEVLDGGGLSLSQAAKLFPGHRRSAHADPSALYRWVKVGSKAADGRTVRLGAVRCGNRLLTSKQALARYIEALSNPTAAPATPTPAAATRERRSARASAKLERMGA